MLFRILTPVEAMDVPDEPEEEEPIPATPAALEEAEEGGDVLPLLPKPTSRSQCEGGVRPCPWVSCRYNLYLDVRADGILRLNFPDREPEEMITSCALDLAEDGPRTLDQVATLMGISRERARQIEENAMQQIRRDWHSEELLGDRLLDEAPPRRK
jgi:hypothetical protein